MCALRPWCAALTLALLVAVAGPTRGDSLAVVPPIAVGGPYPVACSDVAQDFSRMQSMEFAEMYWSGIPAPDGRERYITDLLLGPNTSIVSVTAGQDSDLFSHFANQRFNVAYIVCYPTSAANTRADYRLINGKVIPRMQLGSDAPIFPDSVTRFPVLLFSHGVQDNPLLPDYLDVMFVLVSHGYVVVAPFHGDPRIADLKIENVADALFAALHLRDFVAMQAMRPISLQAVLQRVITDPQFGPHLDVERVFGFGASLGAQSLLLQAGAGLTVSLGLASKPVTSDPLLRAVVGYVPYFGLPYLPGFGSDQHGLDSMRVPFLAIGGTVDTTAPLALTEQGVRRLQNTRGLVALQGVGHRFDALAAPDIFTWTLAFLAAHGPDGGTLRAQAQRMTSVAGGGNDQLRVDYMAPATPAVSESVAVEFYNVALDHYFITSDPAEAAMLDAGLLVPGWIRTGYAFKVWPTGSPSGLSTCRFFGTPGIGPNSHFFTLDAAECAKVKVNSFWTLESYAFQAFPPSNADCPPDRMLVTRLFNHGKGGQANHRYLTSRSEAAAMVAQGWIEEGPVFCTPP